MFTVFTAPDNPHTSRGRTKTLAYMGVCTSDTCHNRGREYFCDIKGKMVCCGSPARGAHEVDYD